MDVKVIDDACWRLEEFDKAHTQACVWPEGCDCGALDHNRKNVDIRMRLRALKAALK